MKPELNLQILLPCGLSNWLVKTEIEIKINPKHCDTRIVQDEGSFLYHRTL